MGDMWSRRNELAEFKVDNSDDPVEVDRSGLIVAIGVFTYRVKPIKKNSSIVDSSYDEESDD